VGADGLHSQVRRLAFGPDEEFEKYLDMVVSVFDVDGYRRATNSSPWCTPGSASKRSGSRFGTTSPRLCSRFDTIARCRRMIGAAQQALLRTRLADAGWETPAMLDLMPQARTFYFDSVSQIRMLSWTRGRAWHWWATQRPAPHFWQDRDPR
jgi:2-polyprenyl-6-methoxyphenol hydroxylase-like FAD-dependent oxidoreductase